MNVNANQVKSVTLCECEVGEGIAKECNVAVVNGIVRGMAYRNVRERQSPAPVFAVTEEWVGCGVGMRWW